MSNEYAGIGGHYWEKDAIVSRGAYILDSDDSIEFGEPVRVQGTGVQAIPFNKKTVLSYEGLLAGEVPSIGVSIEWRRNIAAWDGDDMALRGRQDFKRDISLLKKGGCTIKNMSSGDIIYDGDRVIPTRGGCLRMTATGEYSLGVAKQDIYPLQYGLVDVEPDEEKALR